MNTICKRLAWLPLVLLATIASPAAEKQQAAKPNGDDAQLSPVAKEVRRILNTMKSTEYRHKTQVDEQQGKYFCDCSGLACYVLQQKWPEHYKAVPRPKGQARPLAVDFYRFFAKLPAAPPGRDGWQRVSNLLDARPGDILAWKSDTPKPGSTGHVVFIDTTPVRDKDGQVRVDVIDSTSRGHGSDTRKPGQTGIGRGTMWFTINDDGQPRGYRWSTSRGTLHERPISVGRVIKSDANADR